LIIKINLDELLTIFQDIIRIDKDVGPVVSTDINLNVLNDSEKIVFTLLTKKLTYLLGFASQETATVYEVQKDVKTKSAGALISMMIPEKLIQNIAAPGKKGEYRITDYGIDWVIKKVLPKLEKRNT